jgi:hypothetical protein
MRISSWLVLALAACGASDRPPARPMSAAQHYAEAREQEAAAAEHDRAAGAEQRAAQRDATTCVDRTIAAQSTSGGVPISLVTPCWTSHASERSMHLSRAASLRHDARKHRAVAASLIEAERAACAGLPATERDHSPSWHRDDITAAEPVRDGGPVRGARVTFRKVAGLSVEWLRSAYTCHQAQAAALGFDPTAMSYCPATLPDVTIDVTEDTDGYVVTFTSARDDVAASVLGRALALLEPR